MRRGRGRSRRKVEDRAAEEEYPARRCEKLSKPKSVKGLRERWTSGRMRNRQQAARAPNAGARFVWAVIKAGNNTPVSVKKPRRVVFRAS